MTALGKLLVFMSLILSIASLGAAIWLALDPHDWKKELDAKQKELAALYPPVNRGNESRDKLLVEAQEGARKFKLDDNQLKSVAETRAAILQLVKTNDKLLNDVTTEVEKEARSRRDLVEARKSTEKKLEELAEMSERVNPEKGIPARIDEMTKARLAADREHERLYPEIANGEAAVELLRIRNAELKKRESDLKKAMAPKPPAE